MILERGEKKDIHVIHVFWGSWCQSVRLSLHYINSKINVATVEDSLPSSDQAQK